MELLRNRLEQLQAFHVTSSTITKAGKGRADSMAEVSSTFNIVITVTIIIYLNVGICFFAYVYIYGAANFCFKLVK